VSAFTLAELGDMAQQHFDEIANKLAMLEMAYTEIVSSGCYVPAPIDSYGLSELVLEATDFEGVVLRNIDLLLRFLAGQPVNKAEYRAMQNNNNMLHFLGIDWWNYRSNPRGRDLTWYARALNPEFSTQDLMANTLSILDACGLVLPDTMPVIPGSAAAKKSSPTWCQRRGTTDALRTRDACESEHPSVVHPDTGDAMVTGWTENVSYHPSAT